MGPEQAEMIALRALGWLVGNEELCPVFMGATRRVMRCRVRKWCIGHDV